MLKLSETERLAWHGFLVTHDALWKALEAELARDDLNLPAYELLNTLQEAGGGVRMSELAHKLRFSGGGLTRLAERLERQDFITRRRCPDDGRGFEAVLTEAGKQRLKRVDAKHLREVRMRFLDKLSPDEITLLADIWQRFQE
jgi:DNA-binding MarR family transcriptional regulator